MENRGIKILQRLTAVLLAGVLTANNIFPLGSLLSTNKSDNAGQGKEYMIVANAATTTATKSKYWYNGLPRSGNADNTFHYTDGTTNFNGRRHTYTSKAVDERILSTNGTFGGISSIKLKYNADSGLAGLHMMSIYAAQWNAGSSLTGNCLIRKKYHTSPM